MASGDDLEHLLRWNELNRSNAEHEIATSMFGACARSSEPLDVFATWLLVGSAAVGSFWVVNSDKLIPYIGRGGFLVSGALLCAACFFGLLSKMYGLRIRAQLEIKLALTSPMQEKMRIHEVEEEKILALARARGLQLETEIRMERVYEIFLSALPAWIRRRQLRIAVKQTGDQQAGCRSFLRWFVLQWLFVSIQSVLFLLFLLSGFVFAFLN